MSKFHKIHLGDGYLVRDVPVPPFKKKVRIATNELKDEMLKAINNNANIPYIQYINSRIAYFVDEKTFESSDEEIRAYIDKHLWDIKNDIQI